MCKSYGNASGNLSPLSKSFVTEMEVQKFHTVAVLAITVIISYVIHMVQSVFPTELEQQGLLSALLASK